MQVCDYFTSLHRKQIWRMFGSSFLRHKRLNCVWCFFFFFLIEHAIPQHRDDLHPARVLPLYLSHPLHQRPHRPAIQHLPEVSTTITMGCTITTMMVR